ncbi:MAG: 50S ribosomal protein L11 methyltransferase [Chlamydiae bacterium]|nr:50S ribosomal protein L11 methyltransferase [Chlamydiota bacterium]MBI3265447.1 50S ribosomal protein L11 methyltransferase [Chlamydiota bacterium]
MYSKNLFVLSFTCDPETDPILEWLTSEMSLQATIEEKPHQKPIVKIYLQNKKEGGLLKKKLKHSLFHFSNFRLSSLPSNWTTRWKKGLGLLRIQEWIVCPSWISYKGKNQEKVIRLDPDMAFGTGHHPTTRMCLEWISKRALSWEKVCDIGCGSGILAIAAIKLGVQKALALDIDPEAIEIAQKNAQRNRVHKKILFSTKAIAFFKKPQKYDAAFANLTALDIQKNWKNITRLVHSPKGCLILAGIEKSQISFFEPWLKKQKKWVIQDQKEEGDWKGYLLKMTNVQ